MSPHPYCADWQSCDLFFDAIVNVKPGDDIWPTMVGFELSYGATTVGGCLTVEDARDLAGHLLAAAANADLENDERKAAR